LLPPVVDLATEAIRIEDGDRTWGQCYDLKIAGKIGARARIILLLYFLKIILIKLFTLPQIHQFALEKYTQKCCKETDKLNTF
jgi:hypothetical protein